MAICAFLLALGFEPWSETVRDFLGKIQPFWVREDFTAFYAAGKLTVDGLAAQMYHLPTLGHTEYLAAGRPVGGTGNLAYFNPPFFALLWAPLSQFSLAAAYQIWMVISIALVGVNTVLLWRIAAPFDRPWRTVVLVAYLSLYPLTFGLRLGQFSQLLQLSFAASYLCLRSRQDHAAGAWLALLLIKPELLIPAALYLAVKRRWKAFQTLAPFTLLALVVSIAMVGPSAAFNYPIDMLRSTASNGSGVAPNLMIDWSGIIAATAGHGSSVVRPVLAGLMGIATVGAVVVVALRSREREHAGPERFALEWFALSLATMLADPHFYLQDTIILVPGAVAVLAAAREHVRPAVGAALLATVALARTALYPNQHFHADLLAIWLAALFIAVIVALAPIAPKRIRPSARAVPMPRTATTGVSVRPPSRSEQGSQSVGGS